MLVGEEGPPRDIDNDVEMSLRRLHLVLLYVQEQSVRGTLGCLPPTPLASSLMELVVGGRIVANCCELLPPNGVGRAGRQSPRSLRKENEWHQSFLTNANSGDNQTTPDDGREKGQTASEQLAESGDPIPVASNRDSTLQNEGCGWPFITFLSAPCRA